MRGKPIVWAALAAVLALGVACGGTASSPDPVLVPAPQQPEGAPPPQDGAVEAVPIEGDVAVQAAPVEGQAPVEVEAVAPETQAQPAPAGVIPGRPSAPAPIDADFRSDPATLVGATGNPQLVEFFTFW